MFTHFIESPGEKFITNGFDFAYSNDLIGKDNTLSKLGRLVVESRLDVMDGLALVYAYNCSNIVFKAVFEIITICAYLKSGPDNLFNTDTDDKIKTKLYKKLLDKADNSEHILLFNLYKYALTNKNSGQFNLELVDTIEKVVEKQFEKIKSIYSRFDYNLNWVEKKTVNINIINSFGYGYKSNMAFRSGGKYKYLDKQVDLSKCVVSNSLTTPSIIFYTNLQWFGKLSIMICSPYLLE